MPKIPVHRLNVAGIDPLQNILLCEDENTKELYFLANDDKLQSAMRGELVVVAPSEISDKTSAQLPITPREIQHRIRSGQSVDELAQLTSVSKEKIERFAHPVLLERTRVAHMALAAHPVHPDGPALSKLDTLVNQSLAFRGIAPNTTSWDAWKSTDKHWIIQLSWIVGRSENRAHWQYTPGAHGGMVIGLDDAAKELTDPNFQRTLQSVSGAGRRLLNAYVDNEAQDNAEYEYDDPKEYSPDQSEKFYASQEELFATASTESSPPRSKRHKSKAPVPTWEDVLLGVRSAH